MDISELNRQQSRDIHRHPWELARGKAIRFLLAGKSRNYKHIADIGSGDNFIPNEILKAKLSTNYSCIDTAYNYETIELLKTTTDISNLTLFKSFAEFELIKKPADCVLFLDVLEHCQDDRQVLSAVISSPAIEQDALILITVPAFQKLFSKHDTLLGHYRRYSRKKLIALCTSEKLEVLQNGYFFSSLLPIRVVQKIIDARKFKKREKSIENWRGKKLITKIISSILWIDFHICYLFSRVGIHLPGLSCYCLCRKVLS